MPSLWTLTYPGESLEFGTVESGMFLADAPDLGAREIPSETFTIPGRDGLSFGAGYVEGRTISFSINVWGGSVEATRVLLARLSGAWRADSIRREPGAVATLTSDTGRVIYGRPSRFTSVDTLLPQEVVKVVAEFETSSDLWMDATEERVSIGLMPELGGGLVAPLAAPLATTATSDRSQVFTVGGELPTWPVLSIFGPITNPEVEVVGHLRMQLRTTIAYDQRVTIDTRPHARTILTNGGGSRAGSLTRTSTRLSQAAIPPGAHEWVLRGMSDEGTATAAIAWRDAYYTP